MRSFASSGAGLAGVGAATGQVAENLGASQGSGQQLARDVSQMGELALMSHVPEADLLHGAQAGKFAKLKASPEEIEDFLSKAAQAPGAPTPPASKTRGEIDEFLRQRAAREAGEVKRLPPPDDWAVPQETAAPPPAPATATAAEGTFPSFEEPGRTAPPAVQETEPQVPASPVEPASPPAEPAPPPNTGRSHIEALFKDPRTAAEMRADSRRRGPGNLRQNGRKCRARSPASRRSRCPPA